MDETKSGAGAEAHDDGVADAVEGGIGGRQQAVEVVPGGEGVTGAVVAPGLWHAGAAGVKLVLLAHTGAFATA